jgi:hypothetical protein
MTINPVLLGSLDTGVSIVTAKAYGASWNQAGIFLINRIVFFILGYWVKPYIQNTRQLALAHIALLATSGLAGVLATRLFCEKTIKWKQALAISVTSYVAAGFTISLFMPRLFSEMLNG